MALDFLSYTSVASKLILLMIEMPRKLIFIKMINWQITKNTNI